MRVGAARPETLADHLVGLAPDDLPAGSVDPFTTEHIAPSHRSRGAVSVGAGTIAGVADEQETSTPATFRVAPVVTLFAVAFFVLGLAPIAFQGGLWFLLLLIPVAAAAWVLRVRTVVDTEGLHVRGEVGSRTLEWSSVATLRLPAKGWVRAVAQDDREVTLRGVRVRDLGRVGEASGGRITVPTPAEAAAAEEHARELQAIRMRAAELRAQQEQDDDAEPADDVVATRDGTDADTEPDEEPDEEPEEEPQKEAGRGA